MKPRILYPRLPVNKSKNKQKIYLATSVNKGSNINKSKTISKSKCCNTAKKYFRRKEDLAFNQLLTNYNDDFNRFKNRHKILSKPLRKERTTFNYNLCELKKKNFNVFNYDLKNYEDFDFSFTDSLINSMYNGKNDTLIKTMEIRDDYDMRLKENIKKDLKYNNYINTDENKNIDTDEILCRTES